MGEPRQARDNETATANKSTYHIGNTPLQLSRSKSKKHLQNSSAFEDYFGTFTLFLRAFSTLL